MIQELLGAVVEERRRKSSIPGPLVVDTSPTTSAISSSPSRSAASSPSSAPESLRCPRCDSPNTKFCYYNNYNLTQPRHFCKTCRRYWTKGGALRNVPIGGGCRKTKAAASIIPGIANSKSGGCKPSRPMTGPLGTGGGIGLNLDLLPSLWGGCSVPHSTQLLALLRASQVQQNPNHHHHHHHHNNRSNSYLNSIRMDQVKDEGAMSGAHILTDTSDPLGQICNNDSSSLWRNNNDGQYQYQNQNHLLGDTPTSSGIQELYQRLQSPANGSNYSMQLFNNNVGSGSSSAASATMATTTTTTTTTSASILEPLPLFSGGELGYWNPAPMSWADFPMPNGAFP